ncbi:hypothetical protein ABZ657_14415, partial [Streptomyces sp. NPDC007000]
MFAEGRDALAGESDLPDRSGPDRAALFGHFLEAAGEVLVHPCETAGRQAYAAANAVLVERADRLGRWHRRHGARGAGGGRPGGR